MLTQFGLWEDYYYYSLFEDAHAYEYDDHYT